MVHSDLALRGVPPATTNARPKVALHRLTDLDVFVLDLVAECYEIRPLGVSRDVSGWVELKSGAAPADADDDGMPDVWEKQKGLNPADASDASADRNGDGYTNLEEYLNELAP